MAKGMSVTYLGFDGVATLFAKIHKVENASLEMGESSDTLHFNGVHLFQRVIKDTRGIDDLPSHVAVVEVPNEEGLGGECVRLDVDIRTSDFIEER